ncbi:relaxase domain-containing protein [Streptomyces sp. NPDC088254]|uniref:relaxase domain-containing protein n=1 Tax=Streptomyces sp. NPDC088254 TaxID=3365847 RepID=UPI003826FE43
MRGRCLVQSTIYLQWALGDEETRRLIEAAHERVIERVLEWIEDEVVVIRYGRTASTGCGRPAVWSPRASVTMRRARVGPDAHQMHRYYLRRTVVGDGRPARKTVLAGSLFADSGFAVLGAQAEVEQPQAVPRWELFETAPAAAREKALA